MLFPTSGFLIFFVVVVLVYWAIPPHRFRMLWLLSASCFFYMSWKPWPILLILFSASVDYVVAQILVKTTSLSKRRILLTLSICSNLSLLLFFKYVNFLMDHWNWFDGFFGGHHPLERLELFLPLGISFYTFETISYIVDVYHGRIAPVRSLINYSLYIMFFPHLIAGPIVRPRDFLPQIDQTKRFNWSRVRLGVFLIILGLFKKSVIADSVAPLVDAVFANPSAYQSTSLWLGVLCYAIQIYGDFSGYSDMAIGLSHIVGFKLVRNFRTPYLSADIGEFWRRWHISLSTWLRDYLYIPLGGSRGGTLATMRNLFLTMLLGGLWHGASWTFILWGGYHGALLALNRLVPLPRSLRQGPGRCLAVLGTFLCVCVGWVFFRAQTLDQAATILLGLLNRVGGQSLDRVMTLVALLCLGVMALGHLFALVVSWSKVENRLPAPVLGFGLAAAVIVIFSLMPAERMTFIYFQF
jgi:alginate O-acetyltransferase complex protein AlgI